MKFNSGWRYTFKRRVLLYNALVLTAICLMILKSDIRGSLFNDKCNLTSLNKTKLQMSYNQTQFEHQTVSQTFADNVTNATSASSIIPALDICPIISPKVEGQMKAIEDLHKPPPNMSDIEAAHPEVKKGGRHRPLECVSRHKVAIIIPFRNREAHLRQFLNHMHPFLQRQQLNYGIFVIEQAGKDEFNRAMLMNIGFIESLKLYDWQCFVFHDVDLLPENDLNFYSCPPQPRHMSVAVDTMQYKLPYNDLFGGVTALTKEQMMTVNGFSNEFWGWGGEDDDMKNRISYYGYGVQRYSTQLARYTMLKHVKEIASPNRYNKLYNGTSRIKTDGINSAKYLLRTVVLKKLYTLVNVDITQHA